MVSSNGAIFLTVCVGLILLIFGAAGVYLIVQSNKSKKLAGASLSWPSAPGTILSSSVLETTSADEDVAATYSAAIQYRYEVMGVPYEGSRQYFGAKTSGGRKGAQQTVERYPAGAQVPVYYNPANHADAVLERQAKSATALLVLGIIFVVIFVCGSCSGVAALAYAILAPVQ